MLNKITEWMMKIGLFKKMLEIMSPIEVIIVLLIPIISITVMLGIRAYYKRTPARTDIKKLERKNKIYENIYNRISEWSIFKNYCIRESKKYGRLSVFTPLEIKVEIVKSLRNTIYLTAIVTVASMFIFRDIVAVLLCAYSIYTFMEVQADRKIESATIRIYKELGRVVSSLRIEYKKSKCEILEALENTSCGPRIAASIDRIKRILVDPKMEEALQLYYENTPFKQLQTLAMICVNIYTNGDSATKEDSSVFNEAMLIMEADINQKLEQISYEEIQYNAGIPVLKYLEYLAPVGIVAAIIEKVLMNKLMPATEMFYSSIVGLLVQDGTIALSIYEYNRVARAHLQSVVLPDDRMRIAVRFANSDFGKKVVKALAPKGYKRRMLERKLKLSVSTNTVETLTGECVIFAAIAFVIMTILTCTAPRIQHNFLSTFVKGFDMMADNSVYEDEDGKRLYPDEYILQMDNEYIAARDAGIWYNLDEETRESFSAEEMMKKGASAFEAYTKEAFGADLVESGEIVASEQDLVEIKAMINTYLNKKKLTALEMEDQIARLNTKYVKLKNVKYHWWYILFSFIAAFIAFRYPNTKIKKRLEMAQSEEEEEFLQLQMVTIILSSLNLDTYDTIGHLMNVAEFHKAELATCYYSYVSDPMGALQELEDSIQSENFKLFIGKLKETVGGLSVQEVFADLRNDRVHVCVERGDYIKGQIDLKRGKMGRAALLPFKVAIYGMMVAPLLYSGFSSMTTTLNSLNEIG